MKLVTNLGNPETFWTVAIVLLILGQRRLALGVGIGAGGGSGLTYLVKRLVKRARPKLSIPDFVPLLDRYDPYSFPSGHAAAMFGLATAWTHVNLWLGLVTAAVAAIVASSRIYLGVHYPFDVAAGVLIGLFVGGLGGLVL